MIRQTVISIACRLSLTESCNLRCCYCRPQEPAALPPQELTDAELLHLVQLFAACGIDTLRLTGGELCCAPAYRS